MVDHSLMSASVFMELSLLLVNPDLTALLGVFALWLGATAIGAWYSLSVLRPPDDLEQMRATLGARMSRLFWPFILACLVTPGIWVGLVARSPFWVASAALAIAEVIFLLNRVVKPHIAAPKTARLLLKNFLARVAVFFGATIVGVAVRSLLT